MALMHETVAIPFAVTHIHFELAARALDLVEVNPILDVRNATAVLGTELAASALGQKII